MEKKKKNDFIDQLKIQRNKENDLSSKYFSFTERFYPYFWNEALPLPYTNNYFG
jgi:hypothetical protein